MKSPLTHSRLRSDESGVGLIEIVVALFLLAMLAVSFLPILVQGLKQSGLNATRATAVQLVNEQLELANGTTATCSNLETLGTVPVTSYIDSRNVTLDITRSITACPGSYPGTMTLTVTVTRHDTSEVLSTAKTLLYVETAA